MQARLLRIVDVIRTSYWFIPSVMAALAIALGAAVVWLDSGPATGILDGLGWYQQAKPDGAREVLSAIAASMITVAGVVFSVTIVAISFGANQYGPRLLTNFMGDRGNQVTLGTFIATFVYCLVVLRTIRSGDSEFVPQIAVMLALLLALCSIGVLIYFIHHVPRSIHVNNIVAGIGRQLIRALRDTLPDEPEPSPDPPPHDGAAFDVPSPKSGYIEWIDQDSILEAMPKGAVAELLRASGDFVAKGETLARVRGTPSDHDGLPETICVAHSIGQTRTPFHDLNFLVDELVEITARALSTGVNDPMTAVTCIDWLGAAGRIAGARSDRPEWREGPDGGVLRVRVQDFESIVVRGFARIRQYAARDLIAARHLIQTLDLVRDECSGDRRKALLSSEIEKVRATARELLPATLVSELAETGA